LNGLKSTSEFIVYPVNLFAKRMACILLLGFVSVD
jgi:hypothetical protein